MGPAPETLNNDQVKLFEAVHYIAGDMLIYIAPIQMNTRNSPWIKRAQAQLCLVAVLLYLYFKL